MTDAKKDSLKGLNVRQRKYVKNKASGMSNQQSAIKAGYSKNTAKNAARDLENPGVEKAIGDLIREAGLGEDRILEVVNQALADGMDGATRIWTTKDEKYERPDFAVKHKYLDTLIKLLDKYPATKKAIEHSGGITLNDLLATADK